MEKLKKQSEFCLMLMERLNEDVQKSKQAWNGVDKRTRKQKDIVRLRLELLRLRNMLEVK